MSEREMSEQDTQHSLGKLIDEKAQRDAIHIAVAPVVATERLSPGQRIGLVGHENSQVRASVTGQGIVDPFLSGAVFPGDRFWMWLTPNTITSLRHQWTHPNFDSDMISRDAHSEKSKAWIENHASALGLTYDAMMRHAERWLEHQDYQVEQGSETWRSEFDSMNFWHHYEVITGKVVPDNMKHSFYCCTC